MNIEQYLESATPASHRGERQPKTPGNHHAHDETSTMSTFGLRQSSSITGRTDEPGDPDREYAYESDTRRPATSNTPLTSHVSSTETKGIQTDFTATTVPALIVKWHVPVQFKEFAAQVRLQRYHERRQGLLEARRRLLQKTIALSTRLLRTSSWVRDGLVEISKHADAEGFVHVFQHTQDLVEFCYAQWTHDLHLLDPLESMDSAVQQSGGPASFLHKLSATARADLLDLIHTFRSKPKFLVERFRNLTTSQIAALSTHPKWEDMAESLLKSFSHDRGRHTHRRKRLKAFSKRLEDYASSLERSNPLSFLLFNVFGTDQSVNSHESQLRLSTWSTICAELLVTSEDTYHTLIPQVLDAFAIAHGWRAKDRVELFLMDTLQKGAFLLDLIQDQNQNTLSHYNPLNTEQATDFFNQAVRELLAVLAEYDGGYPIGALKLASAILGKLPTEEQQMQFRGHFFSRWFLGFFLQITITYPENENMLLKVHISKSARDNLLHQLITRTIDKVMDMYSESPTIDPSVQESVGRMINALVLDPTAVNPYPSPVESTTVGLEDDTTITPTLTLCAAEVVQVLEALSPQMTYPGWSADPFMTSLASTFNAQYSRASTKFDRLKGELLSVLEPGSSAHDTHPCRELWHQLSINPFGQLQEVSDADTTNLSIDTKCLDISQQAALRLCTDLDTSTYSKDLSTLWSYESESSSLIAQVQDKINLSRAHANSMAMIYWSRALKHIHLKYPLTTLTNDDSKVLGTPMRLVISANSKCVSRCATLEEQLSTLENTYSKVKLAMDKLISDLDELRLKLWYSAEVTNWSGYEDARNVAVALNNMALPTSHDDKSFRPASRSTASSVFDQPRTDIMSLLKAPSRHGGPRKLADPQIENTRRWLQRNYIDNFCKGEERIHRFCMEVKMLSRKLVGETISESPVLWSSELFARERALYDPQPLGINSAPASTRPASIMSDILSASFRSPLRHLDVDARSVSTEDHRSPFRRPSIYSLVSSRIDRDFLVPELASSIGSHGRASSATTAESASSFWSSQPSISVTSPSIYSRPASVFSEVGLCRYTNTIERKARFLEKMQQGLICLLLSDLGCPVWSCGSETDAWLASAVGKPDIKSSLDRRHFTESLLGGDIKQRYDLPDGFEHETKRRWSIDTIFRRGDPYAVEIQEAKNVAMASIAVEGLDMDDNLFNALEDILQRLGQYIDPVQKLQAVNEFMKLSLKTPKPQDQDSFCLASTLDVSHGMSIRRVSLDTSLRDRNVDQHNLNRHGSLFAQENRELGERDIVKHVKLQLNRLRPKTLFRDLQYIATFSPPGTLDKTSKGKSFLQLGLAALAYKKDVCQSMVEIAHKMASGDLRQQSNDDVEVKRKMGGAAEYWMVAAREGNATAQRELAMLYLSRPEIIPITSLPFSSSADIFRGENMMWQQEEGAHSPALCLALHWMQQAAKNGDQLAQDELGNRQRGSSIR